MPFHRKVVLHVPVSDHSLLEDFVEQCLNDAVSLVAVVGPGCAKVQETIDEIVVGDGSDETRFLCTTSHPNEPLEDVLNMARNWQSSHGGTVGEVRL